MWAVTKSVRAHSKIIKKAIRRATGSLERDARRSLAQVCNIARQQTPAGHYDIRTTPLRVQSRVCLFLHDVLSGRDNVVLSVVEKRSNNPNERLFYSSISPNEPVPGTIAPKVYFIRKRSPLTLPEHHNHIFIEYLPNVGLPDLSPTTARALARHMIKIAELPKPARWRSTYAPKRLDAEFFEQFIKTVRDNGLAGTAVSEAKIDDMRSNWHFLRERDTGMARMVPCHNDLHSSNIGRRATGDGLVFLDWGHFALNQIGSDLHHFLSLGAVQDTWSEFATAVHDEYCKLAEQVFGAPRKDTDFAALSYALYKCMNRAIRFEGSDRSERATMAAVKLYDRVRALPA